MTIGLILGLMFAVFVLANMIAMAWSTRRPGGKPAMPKALKVFLVIWIPAFLAVAVAGLILDR